MATLLEDGTILFGSADELLGSYKAQIAQGGLFLDSSVAWPLQVSRTFTIEIQGMDVKVPIRAEAMYCSGGKVGLQLSKEPAVREAVDKLIARLLSGPGAVTPGPDGQEAAVEPPVPAPRASSAVAGPEDGSAKPSEAESQAPFAAFSGWTVSTRDAAELGSIRPLGLDASELGEVSLFGLVASIVASGHAAVLTVEVEGRTFHFRFNDKGNLVQFFGPDSQADLLERLVRSGLLPRRKQREALESMDQHKSVEALLLGQKLVKSRDMWSCIRNQAVDALERIRAAKRCEYRVDPIVTGRRTGVRFGSLVVPWMDRALSEIDAEQLGLLRGPLEDGFLGISPDATWPPDSLVLEKKGAKFAGEMLDGTRTLTDAMAPFPLTMRDRLIRLAVTLNALGSLEVYQESRAAEEDKPEHKLQKDLEELEVADKFVQAGVHWSAHAGTFPAALARIEREYGPDGELARLSETAARSCRRRVEMARKAHEFLEDASRRKSHRKQMITDSQLRFSAELLFKQADLHLMKGEIHKVRELIEAAIELDPRPEYTRKLASL